jgi:hypothetical protein
VQLIELLLQRVARDVLPDAIEFEPIADDLRVGVALPEGLPRRCAEQFGALGSFPALDPRLHPEI